MSQSEERDDNIDDNEDYESKYKDLYSRVSYNFTYGVPQQFSNIIKRDAALSGILATDLQILVANWIDFMAQMGFPYTLIRDSVVDIVDNLSDLDMAENFDQDEDYDEDTEEFMRDFNENIQEDEDSKGIIEIGDKIYEDIDDIIHDDDSFGNFVEQFKKENNTTFRKVVFRSFLRDTLHGVENDKV